jgi:hypothetical protein
LFDVASRKELKPLAGHEKGTHTVAFSADGKMLAAVGKGCELWVWDLATRERRRRVTIPEEVPSLLAVSPDGKFAALAEIYYYTEGKLVLWDLSTGKQLVRLTGHQNSVQYAVFAPNGRTVASTSRDGTIRLWEVATGKEVLQFGEKPQASGLAFSPNGRLLVSWGHEEPLRLWDIATGMEVGQLKGHQGDIAAVAFSPDGKTLASASEDTTVLVWDVRDRGRPIAGSAAQPSSKELESLWEDLASADASKAHRAVGRLVAAPGQSLPFLRERVRPIVLDRSRSSRLLADLEDDRFAVRERATQELEQLERAAATDLREALAARPSLELRRRVGSLLQKIDRPEMSAFSMRALRALEALEKMEVPEARQLLEVLAKGDHAARLTQEAKAALERLARRSTAVR